MESVDGDAEASKVGLSRLVQTGRCVKKAVQKR